MDKIKRNVLTSILLSYYVSITQEEREEINKKGYTELVKQKIKSGANLKDGYLTVLEEQNFDDDLL